MRLTDHEKDRLLVYLASDLARRRRSNGIELSTPEAKALIADEMAEAARVGKDYDSVLNAGRDAVDRSDVIDGVEDIVDVIQIEAVFPEGTKLVTLTDPFDQRRDS